MPEDPKSVQIVVTGVVQGVFFRAFTLEKANALGITGWVKNLPNGDVMIRAEGKDSQVVNFVGCCKKGPKLAVVRKVTILEVDFENFKKFQLLR